ncbi:hypothetical protein JAO73_06825 [Hymenobacter sp. BT523]|uniref:polysaccharide lyase n=1 Tax=Hymenobacter sp. BT523 TaxID=2795725 RepID=UPI0018EDD909|nr:hypothetical protein [Hymenobacter sp. BT523]MBJ6108713.1 hypothetical protein [Hymenobacter sp. BT523]
MNHTKFTPKGAVCLLFATALLVSCEKDNPLQTTTNGDYKVDPVRSNAIFSNIPLKTFTAANNEYTAAEYATDFGDNSKTNNWRGGKQWIIDNSLRVHLDDGYSYTNGLVASNNVSDGTDYDMSYSFKFDPAFTFAEGGKLGWGFEIGDGASACNVPTAGHGASVRLMWKRTSTTTHAIKPYVYYYDMPNTPAYHCGDNPQSKQFDGLEKGAWYNVYIHVTSNTYSNRDGYLKILIKKSTSTTWTELANIPDIRWTNDHNYRKITRISFDTFRGGDDTSWSGPAGDIFYDDVKVNQLAP